MHTIYLHTKMPAVAIVNGDSTKPNNSVKREINSKFNYFLSK